HGDRGKDMLTSLMAAVAVLVFLFVMMGVKIVRQGYRYTIEHFGRFVRVAEPGFNYVTPFFYRVGRKINMMEQVLDIPGQEIITKDNAMVAVDGVVFFQVLDPAKAAYEVSDLYTAIMALSTTNLRTVMGSMDLDETLSKRDEINTRLLAVVDNATENWGVKITRVELRDIRPPQDIVNAINYFIAQKYVEAVAEFARSPNAKTILFPVEATQLIGTLGGIAELAKDAVRGSTSPKAKAAPSVPKASE